MQLYHFDRAPNFGDALNPWLWPRLLGDRLQARSPTLFLGIGTILKTDLPEADGYAVLSAGGGYGPFPRPDHRWRFYAVRGPLTAQALGLDPQLAATDGAYLLRQVSLPPPSANGSRIGFMPHWQTRLRVPWERICELSGLRYIDPRSPVEETLRAVQGCDAVIAEAMHAAITADALRIRWLPVRVGDQFLDFKWRDWFGSLGLTGDPVVLPAIQATLPVADDEGSWRRVWRRTVNSTAYLLQTRALVTRLRDVRQRLETDRGYGLLSPERTMQQRVGQLQRALDRVLASEN